MTTYNTVGIVLKDDLTHTPGVDRMYDTGLEPRGYVVLDGGTVTVQSTSYVALLALADACQEAARRLRAAQIAGDIEAAVKVA